METDSSQPSPALSQCSNDFIAPSYSFPLTNDTAPKIYSQDNSTESSPLARPARLKRPHTKSRAGCYNCKARRVKCQETKPSCSNCVYKGLECIYPPKGNQQLDLGQHNPHELFKLSTSQAAAPQHLVTVPSSPLSSPFTGDDLRFFHHFLLIARPHLPFGHDGVWMKDVPAFAHDCPHLMHAILSLGATHYALIVPRGSGHFLTAIEHRGKALNYLNAALAKGGDYTVSEMDGILATCYALCFQAHHMEDGLVDFAIMVRGCGIMTNWYLGRSQLSKIFQIQSQKEILDMVAGWLPADHSPVKDIQTLHAAHSALERLLPLLESPAQYNFYSAIERVYVGLHISMREAFAGITEIYSVWNDMGNVEFFTFLAPGNYISRALFMHYITVDVFMRPVYRQIIPPNRVTPVSTDFLVFKWADRVYWSLPVPIRELVRGQIDLIASDLAAELNQGDARPPGWIHELAILRDWLQRTQPETSIVGAHSVPVALI